MESSAIVDVAESLASSGRSILKNSRLANGYVNCSLWKTRPRKGSYPCAAEHFMKVCLHAAPAAVKLVVDWRLQSGGCFSYPSGRANYMNAYLFIRMNETIHIAENK